MAIYRKRGDLTVQAVEEETLLLDVTGNAIHQLNPSASLIWENCDGTNTADHLLTILLEHYDIDADTARGDVRNILEQLLASNLIEEVSQTS